MRSSDKTRMREAIMKLYEETQAASPNKNIGRKPGKFVVLAGTLIYRVHRVIVSLPFRIAFILAMAYLALHLASISVELIRDGKVILGIR